MPFIHISASNYNVRDTSRISQVEKGAKLQNMGLMASFCCNLFNYGTAEP